MVSSHETSVIDRLSSLVRELAGQLPLLDARRAGAEMYGAPRLSFLNLVRPNENALSRIIGNLLDPRGTHGQGPLILNELLNNLGLPRVDIRDFRGVRVGREVLTYLGSRIDIVVETPDVLLGIENKPWAGLSQNQLPDYHCDLKNRAGDRRFRLVFLSDLENEAVRDGIINVLYRPSREQRSLHGIITSQVGKIRAPRARAHVEDLIRYIDQEFGEGLVTEEGDEHYADAVKAAFDGDAANKKALATVLLDQSHLHARIQDRIGKFLLGEVRNEVNEDFVVSQEKMYDGLKVKWLRWDLSRPSWPANCYVSLASEGFFEGVYVGVCAPDPIRSKVESRFRCEAHSKLNGIARKISGGRRTADFPWWQYTEPSDWGPEFAARVVIESPSADACDHAKVQVLARQIVQLAEAAEECLGGKT